MFNSNGEDILGTYFIFPIPRKHVLLYELKYNAAIFDLLKNTKERLPVTLHNKQCESARIHSC